MVRTFAQLVTMFANGTAASGAKFQDLLDTVQQAVGPTVGYHAVVNPGASPSPAVVGELNGLGATAEFSIGPTGTMTLSCTGAFNADCTNVSVLPGERIGVYLASSTANALELLFYNIDTGASANPTAPFSITVGVLPTV